MSTLRINFPEWVRALSEVSEFRELDGDVKQAILEKWAKAADRMLPPITEDTMPGELANIISGRIANVFSLQGPTSSRTLPARRRSPRSSRRSTF